MKVNLKKFAEVTQRVHPGFCSGSMLGTGFPYVVFVNRVPCMQDGRTIMMGETPTGREIAIFPTPGAARRNGKKHLLLIDPETYECWQLTSRRNFTAYATKLEPVEIQYDDPDPYETSEADTDEFRQLVDQLLATYNQYLVDAGLSDQVYTRRPVVPPTTVMENFHVENWGHTYTLSLTVDNRDKFNPDTGYKLCASDGKDDDMATVMKFTRRDIIAAVQNYARSVILDGCKSEDWDGWTFEAYDGWTDTVLFQVKAEVF